MVFLSNSMQMLYLLKIGHDILIQHPFQITKHPTIRRYATCKGKVVLVFN